MKHLALAAAILALPLSAQGTPAQTAPAPSPNQIVEQASAEEWVAIPADDLLVMTLAPDRDGNPREVVIQLMPAPFSQGWIDNIRTLARAGWYDGITVNRVQDNYVVQWGDPNSDNPESEGAAKPLPEGLKATDEDAYITGDLADYGVGFVVQFDRGWTDIADYGRKKGYGPKYTDFTTPMAGRDAYAGFVSFYEGFPIAGLVYPDALFNWPVHCYGMVGVGRGMAPDTGSGAELYTVIGHAPRHLDRNIALVGRIVEGMEHLSSLPRGSGALGFYTADEADKRTPIQSVRLASDLAEAPAFEYLSTESGTFARYVDARANRRDPFFITPAGGADVCNIPVPVRRVSMP